jgi:CubicO group peptidase (beta-lactamase class C family)
MLWARRYARPDGVVAYRAEDQPTAEPIDFSPNHNRQFQDILETITFRKKRKRMNRVGLGILGIGLLIAQGSTVAVAQGNVTRDLPTAKPEKVGLSTERLKRINALVQGFMEANRISGAVTLVARKGRIVHFEPQGVMDVETKRPMRKDTLFAMASSTKPVTGVAVLMLVEDGKVQLADPVSKFIPEFKSMKVAVQKEGSAEIELVPAEREITIRDLLTHTSGLATGGLGSSKMPQELRFPSGSPALSVKQKHPR